MNLPLQALWLRRAFPGSAANLSAGRLVWRGRARPLPTTDTYLLELEAGRAIAPAIFVVSPELAPDHAGRLPHVYDDGSLCVSEFGDWRPGMLLVDTIVPWALEWLVFYEMWRATGLWHGDGPDRLDAESQAEVLHPYRPRRSLTA